MSFTSFKMLEQPKHVFVRQLCYHQHSIRNPRRVLAEMTIIPEVDFSVFFDRILTFMAHNEGLAIVLMVRHLLLLNTSGQPDSICHCLEVHSIATSNLKNLEATHKHQFSPYSHSGVCGPISILKTSKIVLSGQMLIDMAVLLLLLSTEPVE